MAEVALSISIVALVISLVLCIHLTTEDNGGKK